MKYKSKNLAHLNVTPKENPRHFISFAKIVCRLIVENIQAGSDYKKAKIQTYNRLKKECPEILSQWLKYHK